MSDHVRDFYKKFPYPSGSQDADLIFDLANGVGIAFEGEDFHGKTIIDLGCGSGHRLIALAQRFPSAKIVGVDQSSEALLIAKELSHKHATPHVQLIEDDLLKFHYPAGADLVVSTGVIHHLANPLEGFQSIYRNLNSRGVGMVWLYHSIGEFFRLCDRELAQIFSKDSPDFIKGLGLKLSKNQYGADEVHTGDTASVDAFLSPLVRTFRFEEALEFFQKAGFQWSAITSVNRPGESKQLDFSGVGSFSLSLERDLSWPAVISDRFQKLAAVEKLRAIELAWKPTGFTCIGGKGDYEEGLKPSGNFTVRL